jgi:alkanesulfonate monooxygenase SsuD/methylene tetrahydromethanopterin reductase-like flavin-dependent oxidoreductase (luciferase family)
VPRERVRPRNPRCRHRRVALLAKITTTLDVISGGRAILGLGAAYFEEEHRAYGFDFPPLRERLERLEEALQIARLMFTHEESSFEGRHYRTDHVVNNPQPLRGDIPILVGGSGERRTLRMVARYADACNVLGDVDRTRHLMGVLDRHCEGGRPRPAGDHPRTDSHGDDRADARRSDGQARRRQARRDARRVAAHDGDGGRP